ncbi:MAG: hypothetical protein AAF911_14995 [Planctomycetota bacterium]
MKRTFLLWIGVVALAAVPLLTVPAVADDSADYLTPPDAAWGMVLDPGKVRSSALAGEIMQHFDEAERAKVDEMIDGLSNMIGLNLRQDLGRIVVFGDSFAPADTAVAVDIGDARTNVEGFLLTNESYQSYDYGDLIIHSIQDPHKPRCYCAVIPGRDDQSGVLLMSPGQEKIESLVDAAKAGAKVSRPDALGDGDFFRLWIDRIPADVFEGQPRQSNIAGMIQSLEIVGFTGEVDTSFALSVSLTNPARAQQIYQMAAGGKAMVEFAAASDADAAKLADLLAYVRVEQPEDDSNMLRITARCDNEGLAAVLQMLDDAGAFRDLGLN